MDDDVVFMMDGKASPPAHPQETEGASGEAAGMPTEGPLAGGQASATQGSAPAATAKAESSPPLSADKENSRSTNGETRVPSSMKRPATSDGAREGTSGAKGIDPSSQNSHGVKRAKT